VQAEIERRSGLRSATSRTGKAKYSGKYPFSGKLVCGECGSTFRRHIYLNDKKNGESREFAWTCVRHRDGDRTCKQLPIKENILEQIFTDTLNSVLADKDAILERLGGIIAEAERESGESAANEVRHREQD
jgi:hypothetical protein